MASDVAVAIELGVEGAIGLRCEDEGCDPFDEDESDNEARQEV
jgi:hypothetical protein